MFRPLWNKHIDIRALLVFQRLSRFYPTFVILAALISALALNVMSFNEFHPTQTPLDSAAEGLLCSSALTAVVSAVVATMLMFLWEGEERPTRRDLAVAWLPLVLLDLSVVEILVRLVCWYAGKNDQWRGALMITQLMVLLAIAILLAVWMWIYMQREGGLGKEETENLRNRPRVADE